MASNPTRPRFLLLAGLFCVLAARPAASGAATFEGLLGAPWGCDFTETFVPPGTTAPIFIGPYLGLYSLVPFTWDRACVTVRYPYAAASGRAHGELDDFRLMHSGDFSATLESNAWFLYLPSAYSLTRMQDSLTVTGGTGQGLLRLRLSYTATASSSSAQEPFTVLSVYVAGRAPAPFAYLNTPGTLEIDIPFTFGTPVMVTVQIETELDFPELIGVLGA
ncbi:MAG TPA: hypothetical protein VGX68_29340, partial [Thermoanaerobaculia bacterium]|nr:hypothetical protein [Thermoanaerobaculia bacterium]